MASNADPHHPGGTYSNVHGPVENAVLAGEVHGGVHFTTPPPKNNNVRNGCLGCGALLLLAFVGSMFAAAFTPGSYVPFTPTRTAPAGPPAATSPGPAFSGPPLSRSAGPPAGCQEGKAAITRYNAMVGSTPYSKGQAARRAADDIEMALGVGPTGAIREDLQNLGQDFTTLAGTAMESNSLYDAALAQTQKNIQALYGDCNAAG